MSCFPFCKSVGWEVGCGELWSGWSPGRCGVRPSGSALLPLRLVGLHGGAGLQSAAGQAEPGAGPCPQARLPSFCPAARPDRVPEKTGLGVGVGGNTRCLHPDQGQTWGTPHPWNQTASDSQRLQESHSPPISAAPGSASELCDLRQVSPPLCASVSSSEKLAITAPHKGVRTRRVGVCKGLLWKGFVSVNRPPLSHHRRHRHSCESPSAGPLEAQV